METSQRTPCLILNWFLQSKQWRFYSYKKMSYIYFLKVIVFIRNQSLNFDQEGWLTFSDWFFQRKQRIVHKISVSIFLISIFFYKKPINWKPLLRNILLLMPFVWLSFLKKNNWGCYKKCKTFNSYE